ncbi:hypothetical protein [Allomuricauda sp. SCSIO 65647]|uniref:hypothetical protein n=1 Tax=Allomuricauda sp. SCSIO 65647 TaxID=2908843 RepID=UPI001F1FE1E5|nr:hypothetical protein [Muricauda sp. SCSIO 65647]UJH66619.1 hypothetical protein L0P89_11670 [Muricauda sp. SCSIO 65647]
MKRVAVVMVLMLYTGLTSTPLFGQTYQYPSQERVQELLDEIEDCKQKLKNTQAEIKNMEANPSDYTLADYKEAEMLVERIKTCLAARRAELDSIRKEYPGWFNSPNAVLPYDRHNRITPRSLEERLKDLERKISQVLNRFEGLPKPKGR